MKKIQHYKQQLRDRFANPGLRHRTWQIAMDGSQKLPQRLLGSLRDQLNDAGHIDMLCLAVAAWIRYVSAIDEAGNPIDVQDPLAQRLKACHEQHSGNIKDTVQAIVSIREVFGDDLRQSKAFTEGLAHWLHQLYEHGVLASIKKYFALEQ